MVWLTLVAPILVIPGHVPITRSKGIASSTIVGCSKLLVAGLELLVVFWECIHFEASCLHSRNKEARGSRDQPRPVTSSHEQPCQSHEQPLAAISSHVRATRNHKQPYVMSRRLGDPLLSYIPAVNTQSASAVRASPTAVRASPTAKRVPALGSVRIPTAPMLDPGPLRSAPHNM